MKSTKVERIVPAVLLGIVVTIFSLSAHAQSAKPTPTWTTAQQKAYETRMRMYHKPFFMKPSLYVCAFCGYKGDGPGICPRCGFELTRYDPQTKAPASKGMAYHCEKCGLESDKGGTCPRCGGKMVKNP